MMLFETKDINILVNGKDNLVQATKIQRHLPECKMILFYTETNHTLFCQENHPVIITRNKKEITVNAEEVCIGDYIHVNNTICSNNYSMNPKNSALDITATLFNTQNSNNINFENINILKGNTKETIRFIPDFINFNRKWIKDLLYSLSDIGFRTESYVLIQQLKLMADKININLKINLYREPHLHFGFTILSESNYRIINDKIRINIIEKNIEWKNYVYDIKTITEEFLLGCVQNHNSFHGGGVVTIDTPDIIKEMGDTISDSNSLKLKNNLRQEDNFIYSKNSDIILEIINSKYEDKFKIQQKDDYFTLPTGIFYLTVVDENFKIEIHIEREMVIFFPKNKENINITKDVIQLIYNSNEKILEAKGKSLDYAKIPNRVDDIIGGKTPDSSVESIYLSLFNTLKETGDWDSVHLEIIMSNIFRWPNDPQIPSRLKRPFKYEQFSIKTLPMIISWTLGLAFENATKAITYGLISERGPESEIEKILVGDI